MWRDLSESNGDMGAFQVKLHELLSIAQPLGIQSISVSKISHIRPLIKNLLVLS